MSKKTVQKILIVEDEIVLARALELKLKNEGFEVELAGNGEEGFKKITKPKAKYDLILIDLIMPKMSGFEVLEKLKKTKNLSIIVTSNLSQKEDLKKALDLGAKDYIIKSNTSLSEIVAKVKKFLKVK